MLKQELNLLREQVYKKLLKVAICNSFPLHLKYTQHGNTLIL